MDKPPTGRFPGDRRGRRPAPGASAGAPLPRRGGGAGAKGAAKAPEASKTAKSRRGKAPPAALYSQNGRFAPAPGRDHPSRPCP